MGQPEFSTIRLERTGAVAYLRFDRPERHNTVTPLMVEEVHAALAWLAQRDDVRVVVLTGNGSTFCPGADLERAANEPFAPPPRESYRSAELLVEMPQVTLAAVNGGCAGAGFAWAAACDLRIAAARARIAVAFLDVGVPGELGAAWTVTRIVGTARARDLFLLPRVLDATEALDIGLVSRVHADDDFTAEVRSLATALAEQDPEALRLMKANLVDAERLGLHDYVTVETDRHLSRFSGDAASATVERFRTRARDIGHRG